MLNACVHAMYHYLHAPGGARIMFWKLLMAKHCFDSSPDGLADILNALFPGFAAK